MGYRDADMYNEVADVLGVLHDTVDMYISSMQDNEDSEHEGNGALASASPTPTAAAAMEVAITRQHILANVPHLLYLCLSVRRMLRRAALLTRQPSRGNRSKSLSASDSMGRPTGTAARNEAARDLVLRKLSDVMENAHMIRGLVKLQHQQQHQQPSNSSYATSLDDTDGPLRMKQLIRVTLYNLEDTERLLRAAYLDEPPTGSVAGDGDDDDEADGPPLFPQSSPTRRTLARPYGQRLSYNGGGADHEGSRDSISGDGGGMNSSLPTPRSSTHTAPYMRHSSSLEPTNLLGGLWTTPNQDEHDSDNEAAPTVHLPGTAPALSTGAHSTSIVARSPQAEPFSAPTPFVTSAPKLSSSCVHFAIDKPPDSDDQNPSRCHSGLLSNPVVRRGSTDSDGNGHCTNDNSRHTVLSSELSFSGDGGGILQSTSFEHPRPSLTSVQHSSTFSAATTLTTVTETEGTDTTSTTPAIAEALQRRVSFSDRCSDPVLASSVTPSTPSMVTTDGTLNLQVLRLGDGAPPRSDNGNSNVSSRGAIDCALSPLVGLPPRSPRWQNLQQLPISSAPLSGEVRLPHAPSPAFVGPDTRVTTCHMQRLPGELWNVIMADRRAEMEDVLRADVMDLFNYGEAAPTMRGEDVREVHFTVVGTHLYIRIELEHLRSLEESEINMRLNLCSYPLMTGLYEEFLREHQARELDPVEDTMATLSSSDGGARGGGNEKEKGDTHGSVEQCTKSMVGNSVATSYALSMPNLRVAVGKSDGSVGRTGAEASTAVASSDSVDVESSTLFREGATAVSASRHPHTVRIPGVHWAHLLALPGLEKSDLKSAFVQDTGVALGVLPSEARAACQVVCLSPGSLVVNFVWDNAELYPGAVPLSVSDINAALQSCPYPSVRAFYANACAKLHLDDDLAVVPAAKHTSSSDGGGTAECVIAQLVLPNKSELDFSSSTDDDGEGEEAVSAPKSSSEGGLSTVIAPMARALEQAARASSTALSTVKKVLYAADKAPAASARVDSLQKQRGAPVPSFSRMDSTMSSESAEEVPRVAVPQPTVGSPIHSQKGRHQQRRRVHSSAGTSCVGAPATATATVADSSSSKATARRATLESSRESATLNQFALIHGVSVSVLRQWNPALAELDADAVIPATATLYVPRLLPSSARKRWQAEPSLASEAGHHSDPTDDVLAAVTSTTPHLGTACLPASAAHPSAKTTAPPAASHAILTTVSSSPVLSAPKPLVSQHQPQGPPLPQTPAQAGSLEKAKNTTTTIPIQNNNTPVATPLQPPSLSVKDVERRRAFLTSATVQSAKISASPSAVAVAPSASIFPIEMSRSTSPSLETQAAGGAKMPPGAIKVAKVPAQLGTTSTEQTAPLSAAVPTLGLRSTREVLPLAPQPVSSMTTAKTAETKAPPAYIVYQLPKPQIDRAAEPRGIEAILAAHRVPRLRLDRVEKRSAAAVDDDARARAIDEEHVDYENRNKAVDRSTMLWERELGLRLDSLTVVQVRRGSVAARANVQPGDTLREVNGQVLLSQNDFQRTMAHLQQQHRKRSEGRTVFVAAMTSRGTPVTYHLRLPPLHRDGTAARPDLPAEASTQPVLLPHPDLRLPLPLAAQQQTPPPLSRALPLSARLPSTPRGPQQHRGLQCSTQGFVRAPAKRAVPVSARTPVSTLDAAAHDTTRGHPGHASPVLLRHAKAPASVRLSSIGVGGAELGPGLARGIGRDDGALTRTRKYAA
nr:unnamed protein product [Leishmania braziliensis]